MPLLANLIIAIILLVNTDSPAQDRHISGTLPSGVYYSDERIITDENCTIDFIIAMIPITEGTS